MQRSAVTLFAAILLLSCASSLFAQSGTRNSSFATGLSPSARATAPGTTGPGTQAGFLQSQTIAFQSQAQSNYQFAETLLQGTQAAMQTLKQTRSRNRAEAMVNLRETNIRKRQKREFEKAMKVESFTIAWPAALQEHRYDKHRAEVEAIAKLHAELGDKVGVKTGFKIAVRRFAQQIIRDENAGVFSQSQSREIRTFVRAVNQNYGQFSDSMKQKMSQKMLVSKM